MYISSKYCTSDWVGFNSIFNTHRLYQATENFRFFFYRYLFRI